MAIPVVRLEASPSVLVETEETLFTFTFRLSEAPPSGGVKVTVTGNVPQSLNQFDLFDVTVNGGDFPEGDFDFSGFDFNIKSQTATITLPIFDDDDTDPRYNGERIVLYTLQPGRGYAVDSGGSQVSVTFRDEPATNENRPPVANDDSGTTAEDRILNGNVRDNDSDPDGDSITVTALNGNTGSIGTQVVLNSGALLTLNGNGSYVYNPNGRFDYLNNGQTTGDSFSYTISDGKGGTDNANVLITITGVTPLPNNQNPVAVNDTGSTSEKQALGGNVLSNDSDPDGDPLVVSTVNGNANVGVSFALPSGAILTLNADGNYNYNPNGVFNYLNDGQTATDSFSYTIDDGKGGTATATVTVTVLGVTDAPPGFDPAQYGASYSDLIQLIGYDLPALTNHYINSGQTEGRSTDLFDEFRYIASYPDLAGFYGLNGAGATEHYIRHGFGEGRSATTFIPSRYLLSYDDLLGAFGTDTVAGTKHYITNGIAENRNPNLFASDRYIATYEDLIRGFEYNLEAGSNHYLISGRGEGRQILFNPQAYLDRYVDLQQAFGGNLTAATRHYITDGFEEGRTWM
jgi:VCBS repeat-containing protein